MRACRDRNQRRIAEHDQQVVGAAGDGIAGREHRVRGAETLALNEGGRIRPQTLDLLRDSPVVRSDDDGERGAGALWGGFKHMRQQRLAGDGMQDLRHRRLHARALTGREHDREAGSAGHPNPYSMVAKVAPWSS